MDAALLSRLGVVSLGILLLMGPASAADKPSPRESAARIDTAFQHAAGKPLGPIVDDEIFIRRVTLDLTGKVPEAEDIRRFQTDTSADKRSLLIEHLLASEAYAVNWGRYWRDVL